MGKRSSGQGRDKCVTVREFIAGCLPLIQEARRQFITYEEITDFWMETLGIAIDPSTVRKTVKDLDPDWQEPKLLTLKELAAQKAQAMTLEESAEG